jgi:hypothetical protein
MNMSLTTHSSLRLLMAGAFAVASAACASAPTPPPAAAAPPSNAFAQAASPGAAEAQGDDGVVFVDQGRKDPTTHTDTPATGLHADTQTARPVANPQH